MKNNILVSIITVVYNGEQTIAHTIESVLDQSYSNIEYIVMDGNSSDKTVEIAKGYVQKFCDKGYSYKIVSKKDKGMYDALNKGAQLASGELVGQINADDWYEPEAVEKMVKLYQEKIFDVAWGNIRVINKNGSFIKRAYIGKIWTTAGFCHPSMFSKREILLSYPYALENMYDDFDYATRVYLDGKRICTTDTLISNFVLGGMSSKKGWAECKKRIGLKWHGYKKYHMSKFYWFYCFLWEFVKYILA